MIVPEIPILRQGQVYLSKDVQEIHSLGSNDLAAKMHWANAGLIKRDILSAAKAARVLQEIPTETLIEIFKKAGELFLNGEVPLGVEGAMQGEEDYVRALSSTSGLSHSLIRMNMQKLQYLFDGIEDVIQGLTRGVGLEVLDKGYGTQDGVPVSFCPNSSHLGVILPSNSPAVNALWLPSIIFKVPVMLKPGREEPWTPLRMIQSLILAGCPKEAFSFYPTSHDGSALMARSCRRVMLFGDDKTTEQYAHDPRVEVHGTGHTKILIGDDKINEWECYLDVLVESVAANSGRSCINTSTIVVPSHADKIAQALADKLSELRPLPVDDPSAVLAGFANPKMAEWIDGAVNDGLNEEGAKDFSANLRSEEFPERHAFYQGMHYLLPTVVRVESFEHNLANKEFLFPYVSIIELPESEMLENLGYSLVVTAITENQTWIRELLQCSNIDRLNVGLHPTCKIEWNQPHEGNLFEFLFQRKAIKIANLKIV